MMLYFFNRLMRESELYVSVSEFEVSGGDIDVWLERSPLLPDIPYEWAWEIKYVRKKDEALLEAKKQEALAQLARYRNGDLYCGILANTAALIK